MQTPEQIAIKALEDIILQGKDQSFTAELTSIGIASLALQEINSLYKHPPALKGFQTVDVLLQLTPAAYNTTRKWASVSRTFDMAERQLENWLNMLNDLQSSDIAYVENEKEETERDSGETSVALDELKELHYLCDTLHQQVRQRIWQIEAQKGASKDPNGI